MLALHEELRPSVGLDECQADVAVQLVKRANVARQGTSVPRWKFSRLILRVYWLGRSDFGEVGGE